MWITLGAYGSLHFLWSSSLHICGAEEFLLLLLTLHLQSAQQKMDPRSDSGRESVSSQWWEGVDKKKFVLLSVGGRRQRKADNSDSSVLLYFV